MADFSNTQLSAPSTGINIKAPSQGPNYLATASQFAANALNVISTEQSKTAAFKPVKDFTEEQTKLIRQLENGNISQSAFNTRYRVNFNKYAASNPAHIEQFSKISKSLRDNTTAGESFEAEQSFQDMVRANRNKAYENGFIPVNATQEQERVGTEMYIARNKAIADMEYNAKIGKANSESNLAELASTSFYTVQNRVNAIVNGNLSAAEKTQQLQILRSETMKEIRMIGAPAGSDAIGNYTAIFDNMFKVGEGVLTGSINLSELENYNKVMIESTKAELLSNPKTRQLVATSNLFGDNLAALPLVNEQVATILSNNPEGTPPPNPLAATKEDVNKATNIIKLAHGSSNEAQKAAAIEKTGQLLKGIDVYQMSVEGPKQFAPLVDFLASREFGEMSPQLDGALKAKAADAIRIQYSEQAVPVMTERFHDVVTQYGNQKTRAALTDVVDVKFTGSGIVFTRKSRPVGSYMQVGAEHNLVKKLNEELAPVANRILRTGSHLSNNPTGYEQYWEANKETLFPELYPKEEATNGEEGTN